MAPSCQPNAASKYTSVNLDGIFIQVKELFVVSGCIHGQHDARNGFVGVWGGRVGSAPIADAFIVPSRKMPQKVCQSNYSI
jgi:hypothetical protein